MKKLCKILSILTAISLSAGMTGCTDKLKSSIPAFSELDDGGYIKPFDMFFDYDGENFVFYEDGDAYENVLDDAEMLMTLKPLILEGDSFQYYFGGNILCRTSGSWKDAGDKLEFSYDEYSLRADDGTWNTIYADAEKNEGIGLHQRRIDEGMNAMAEADEDDTLIDYVGEWNDKGPALRSPRVKCGEEWEMITSNGVDCNCILKGSCILAEQRGLAFEGAVLKNEFTIIFDRQLAEPDEYDESDIIQRIVFSSDNTYSGLNAAGEWTIYDEHLLILHPSEDSSSSVPEIIYVDLDAKEIYIPLYVKCDGVSELAR